MKLCSIYTMYFTCSVYSEHVYQITKLYFTYLKLYFVKFSKISYKFCMLKYLTARSRELFTLKIVLAISDADYTNFIRRFDITFAYTMLFQAFLLTKICFFI